MSKTKSTPVGKVGENSPAGATLLNTEKPAAMVQMPAVPQPKEGSQFPYLETPTK